MKKRLLLLGVPVLLAGSVALTRETGASASPLARHALTEPMVLEGHVAERLRAGPYLYLRLDRPGDADVWIATLAKLAPSADDVSITAVARADTFPSKRLGRSFSPLLFGAVRAASSTPTPEQKP